MVIGIIGGGQLAKMLILAGYPMGQEFIVLDPSSEAAGGRVAPQITGEYDDEIKLLELAEKVDLVTFDFENVPAAAIKKLQQSVPVYPPVKALSVAQDRLLEKNLFKKLNIATPTFADIPNIQSLYTAVQMLGLPAILKTRRMGYDGKGQFLLRNLNEIEAAWKTIAGQAAILETFIPFDFEVSLLSVRNRSGETAFYPLVHNTHKNGILNISIAPFHDIDLQRQAETQVIALLQELNYVGVLAVEFFVKNKQLIANEMAPRVHNSGHWTIEGAGVSQFENHLRAIMDLPLGTTDVQGYAAMINFISRIPPAEDILKIPGCHFHSYGKTPRPGRKLGHATLRAADKDVLNQKIQMIQAIIEQQYS